MCVGCGHCYAVCPKDAVELQGWGEGGGEPISAPVDPDALRDGAILYAEKLKSEGIETELHNTKGTVHGYDMMLKSSIVQDLIGKRVAFLRRAFR